MKLKRARTYTQKFKLKLIAYILQFLKKVLGAYSGLIYIFVNNYNVEARCAFLCPP